LMALEKLEPRTAIKLNLGTGRGASVREVIDCVEKVTGKPIATVEGERREGDPPELVANPDTAEQVIGWRAEHDNIRDVVASAWSWHQSHPNGFDD
ncbi:MAG: UDP-glucose 4-epimerase GalE, partial [Planctomycetota bacterium]